MAKMLRRKNRELKPAKQVQEIWDSHRNKNAAF